MVFDIWSVGDYRFFAEVLNSIASWAGTGSPARIASIGMLISFVTLAIQSIIAGGKMPQYQHIIIGWIFYAFLFGPGVTVVVKDSYSLHTSIVDNVPVGLAATGSVISNLTHSITEEIEQAFSLPTMVDDVFAGALKILADSRNLAFPTQSGVQLNKSLVNYMMDCTNVGILRGELSAKGILKTNNDPMSAIRWDSEIFTTKIYLTGNSNPPAETCTSAYNKLHQKFSDAAFWTDWDVQLEGRYGVISASNQIQNTLDTMTSSGVDAKKFMLASTFYDLFKTAQEQGAIQMADPVLAASVSEALNSRDAQAAADAQLFRRIARPGMTFFETATYTIAPFMAFLVVLVPMGMSLVPKYFMLNIWVQLWMPSLAVLNFMGNFIMQNKISAVANSTPITSMVGAQNVFFVAQDWMSTVNNLAAMVPIFTMFIVSGSMYGMGQIASRMSGSDHYDEKKMSPDVMQNNPLLTNNLGSLTSSLGGITQTDATKKSWGTSQNLSQSVESAHAEMKQSSEEMFRAAGQGLENNTAFQSQRATGEMFRDSIGSQRLESSQLLHQKASAISHAIGAGDTQTSAIQNALAMDLSAGGSAGFEALGNGMKVKLGGSATNKAISAYTNSTETATNLNNSDMMTLSETEQEQFTEAVAHDLTNSQTTAWMGGSTFKDNEQVGNKITTAKSDTERYNRATSLQDSFSQNFTADSLVAGAKAVNVDGLSQNLENAVTSHNIMPQVQALQSQYQNDNGGGSTITPENRNRAIFHALADAAQGGNSGARDDLMRYTAAAYGLTEIGGAHGDATSNEGISNGVAQLKVPTQLPPDKVTQHNAAGSEIDTVPGRENVTNNTNQATVQGQTALNGHTEQQATVASNILTSHIDHSSPADRVGDVIAKGKQMLGGLSSKFDALMSDGVNADTALQTTQTSMRQEFRDQAYNEGLHGNAAELYAAEKVNQLASFGFDQHQVGNFIPEAIDTDQYTQNMNPTLARGVSHSAQFDDMEAMHLSANLQRLLTSSQGGNENITNNTAPTQADNTSLYTPNMNPAPARGVSHSAQFDDKETKHLPSSLQRQLTSNKNGLQ